jgi:putative endonuclease
MLRCFDGTFYTGVTNDVDERYYDHCHGNKKDSYTYSRRPLRLAYVGEFDNIQAAIAFEKKLKSWTHAQKRAFAERCARGRSCLG